MKAKIILRYILLFMLLIIDCILVYIEDHIVLETHAFSMFVSGMLLATFIDIVYVIYKRITNK